MPLELLLALCHELHFILSYSFSYSLFEKGIFLVFICEAFIHYSPHYSVLQLWFGVVYQGQETSHTVTTSVYGMITRYVGAVFTTFFSRGHAILYLVALIGPYVHPSVHSSVYVSFVFFWLRHNQLHTTRYHGCTQNKFFFLLMSS